MATPSLSVFKRVMNFSSDDVVVSRAPLLAKAIAKAPPGEGCPRCGGYVYAAEQMLARGRVNIT